MCNKLRQVHNLQVPRRVAHAVNAVMYDLDPEGLEARRPCFKKKEKKGHFTTLGTNWVHSLDGYNKLMGYQNSTFPIAVYGCIDTCSRKLLWVKTWMSNSDPRVIGRWYIEHLYKARAIPCMSRIDRGSETGKMAAIHGYI